MDLNPTSAINVEDTWIAEMLSTLPTSSNLYCPVCRNEFIQNVTKSNPNPKMIPDNQGTLASFREPERNHRLKNAKIRILDGKYQDQCGYFLYWNGNNAVIKLDTAGKKLLSPNRMIEILPTELTGNYSQQITKLNYDFNK